MTFFSLEKEMVTHSSTLGGQSHGWKSLVGYSPWGRNELDRLSDFTFTFMIYEFIFPNFRNISKASDIFTLGPGNDAAWGETLLSLFLDSRNFVHLIQAVSPLPRMALGSSKVTTNIN